MIHSSLLAAAIFEFGSPGIPAAPSHLKKEQSHERIVGNVANGAITILQIVRSWAKSEIETPEGCTSNNA